MSRRLMSPSKTMRVRMNDDVCYYQNDKISASCCLISPLELLVELVETDFNLQESYSQLTSFTVTPPAGGSAIPVTFEITFTDDSATGGILWKMMDHYNLLKVVTVFN